MTTELKAKTLYDQDFYLWLEATAKLLREKNFQDIDLDNLIEEIESMGRSEKRELRNRVNTVLEHLLKIAYWETEKTLNMRGWKNTIIEQREQILGLLKDSPSLENFLEDIFQECYQDTRKIVARKTDLSINIFPQNSPFKLEQVLNPDYFYDE